MAMKNKIKREILLIFVFALIILIPPLINAHFVCGELRDSDEMQAQWYDVRVFYPYDREEYSECQVSPAGNKYCCDIRNIKDGWNVGEEVSAEVFDNENGYVAGPISLITSGEGYDVFPSMKLEKVVKVHNLEKLIISDSNLFLLNASFKEPYNLIEFEDSEKRVLCENCSEINEEINTSFGMNYFKLFAFLMCFRRRLILVRFRRLIGFKRLFIRLFLLGFQGQGVFKLAGPVISERDFSPASGKSCKAHHKEDNDLENQHNIHNEIYHRKEPRQKEDNRNKKPLFSMKTTEFAVFL